VPAWQGLAAVKAFHAPPYLHALILFRHRLPAPDGVEIAKEPAADHQWLVVMPKNADFVLVHGSSPPSHQHGARSASGSRFRSRRLSFKGPSGKNSGPVKPGCHNGAKMLVAFSFFPA
jgi:hypothetical protein